MKNIKGGTLIELIIVLVIMAIAAALFVTHMNTTYKRSPESAGLVGGQYQLIQQMEVLTGKYRQALQQDNNGDGEPDGTISDLCAFKTSYVDNLTIDGVNIVDTAHTSCNYSITDTTNTYTTAAGNALLVTLTYKGQTLQCIFTK